MEVPEFGNDLAEAMLEPVESARDAGWVS